MYSDTLFWIWLLVIPIAIIEVSTPRIWILLHYFSSLHDFWLPSTWHSLVHTSWGEMERCEKRAFQLLKMRKKISWNIKSKCITEFLSTVRSSRMKDYTCHYDVNALQSRVYINFKKITRIWNFLFTRNQVCKHKEFDSKLHVCTKDVVKICSSYLFHFSTSYLTSTN